MQYHFVHFQKSMIIVQRSSNATMTINSLNPITNYTVTVQCKLTNARYWSQKVTSVLFNTESASKLYIFLFFCPLQILHPGYLEAIFENVLTLCHNIIKIDQGKQVPVLTTSPFQHVIYVMKVCFHRHAQECNKNMNSEKSNLPC